MARLTPVSAVALALFAGGCSMVPYYSQVKAVADTGIATAVDDRRAFNDRKLAVNLAALCDSSIGAVNRHPDTAVRDFVNRLCGGDGAGVTADRLSDMLRLLDAAKGTASKMTLAEPSAAPTP